MIIVSQDKINTTDSLNLKIEVIVEEKGEFPNIQRKPIGYCIVDKKYSTQLGTYKTEERAKEVFQEIVNLYKQCEYVNGEISYIVINKPKVYEMPEN